MNYEIEKNVPIPESKTAKSEFYDFLFTLDIGDSFLVKDKSKFSNIKTMASNFKKRYNKKFTTRQSHEGLRIWRVA